MLGKDRSYWTVGIHSGLGEVASGFGCWRSGGCSRLLYRGPRPFRENADRWLISGLIRCNGAAFSLLEAICPVGML